MSLGKDTRKNKQKGQQTRKRRSSGSQIHLYSVSKHIRPGDDFYAYVNEKWFDKAKIPPTKSQYGVSEEIEKKIEKQTDFLLDKCLLISKQKPKTPTYMESLQTMLGDLTQSVQTADKTNQSLELTKNVLLCIQSLQSPEEVGVLLGEFIRYKVRSVLNIYGQYENKNEKKYSYTISTASLGLESSFYLRRSMHRGVALALYSKMIKQLGKLFKIPNYTDVIGIEKNIAKKLLAVENETIEYERTGTELQTEFKMIPFAEIFKSMGLTHWQQRIFFVESLHWLKSVNTLFHTLDLESWKLLLSHHFVLFALPWLPPPYSNLSFQFYRKQMRGQEKKISRESQAIYVIQQFATMYFSRLYAETMVNPEIKQTIETMIQLILDVAEKRLDEIHWLEPKTREKAQEKIQKMRFIVAYPDSFERHSIPNLSEKNLLQNLLTLGQAQTEYEIQKLGQPITQRKEWDDAVFVVNAYYYTQANEMVIPAGILQDPFYDMNKSMAWNLGGIGCILCHELTHAFDKEGKEYNPEGYQKKWWTPSDNRNYNKQTKALIDLYSKQKIFGFHVSGKKTLSENIADIGGMGIALDALHKELDKQKLTGDERKQAYRDFFISYATSWRLKEKKKKRIQALLLDKHAPPNLRVNLVVSQFQEWYDAFNIQAEDSLYIPPEKRIRIF